MGNMLPEKSATVFISTGELSGDMHAAHLVKALQELRVGRGLPPAIIEANGSIRLSQAGAQLLHDVATWGEIGIFANMAKIQFLHRAIKSTLRYVLSNHPDLVVLVDSPFFNLNLARMLRDGGYTGKIVYYISPIRWQSLYDPAEAERSLRSWRFLRLKRYCDFAIPIYPISLATYDALEIPYEFPGHPLCETAKPRLSDAQFYDATGIECVGDEPPLIIGALPGSRREEIKHIAPSILRALALMRDAFAEDPTLPPLHTISVLAHRDLLPELLAIARQAELSELVLIEPELVYDLMSRARLMIVKSGTGLHECMLTGVPAIMCYRVAPAAAWVARHLMHFRMPYFGFPNLLANQPVVPELIQEECNHRRIVDLAGSLMFEEHERQVMLDAFAELRKLTCKSEPLKRTAEIVQGFLPA